LEQLRGVWPLTAGGDEVDVVVGTREQQALIERDLDREAAKQTQPYVGRRVQHAQRLANCVGLWGHDAHRTSTATALSSRPAERAMPASNPTTGSSCSIEIDVTPRRARASRNARHHEASWPRPTTANVHGASDFVGDQRWSSSPLKDSSSSLKTTSFACACPILESRCATASGSIRCQKRWLGSRFAATFSEIAASRSNVSTL